MGLMRRIPQRGGTQAAMMPVLVALATNSSTVTDAWRNTPISLSFGMLYHAMIATNFLMVLHPNKA